MNGEFVRGECKWCGEKNSGDGIADYYHEKRCHRSDVLRRIDEAKKNYASGHPMMRRLRYELELASDTGD